MNLETLLSQENRPEHLAAMVKEYDYYHDIVKMNYETRFYKIYYDYVFNIKHDYDFHVEWKNLQHLSLQNIQEWLSHSEDWVNNRSDEFLHLTQNLKQLFNRQPTNIHEFDKIRHEEKIFFVNMVTKWNLTLMSEKSEDGLVEYRDDSHLLYLYLTNPEECVQSIIKLYQEQSDVMLLTWHQWLGLPVGAALLSVWEQYGYHYIKINTHYEPRHVHWSRIHGLDLTSFITRPELESIILPPSLSYEEMSLYSDALCVPLFFHHLYPHISKECDIMI